MTSMQDLGRRMTTTQTPAPVGHGGPMPERDHSPEGGETPPAPRPPASLPAPAPGVQGGRTTEQGPVWAPVDESTGDLLELLADDGTIWTDYEWNVYAAALRECAEEFAGLIFPDVLRPKVRGAVKPCRIGAYANRAVRQGLIRPDGWEVSDDVHSGNSGKPARIYRWTGALS